MSIKRTMDAVAAARDVHQEAFMKLTKVIARKRRLRRAVDNDVRLRTTANRRLSNYTRRLLELEAAQTVVNPPTPEDLAEVRAFIREVRDLAATDAMRATGLKVISGAMARSAEIAAKSRPG